MCAIFDVQSDFHTPVPGVYRVTKVMFTWGFGDDYDLSRGEVLLVLGEVLYDDVMPVALVIHSGRLRYCALSRFDVSDQFCAAKRITFE